MPVGDVQALGELMGRDGVPVQVGEVCEMWNEY